MGKQLKRYSGSAHSYEATLGTATHCLALVPVSSLYFSSCSTVEFLSSFSLPCPTSTIQLLNFGCAKFWSAQQLNVSVFVSQAVLE